MASKNFSPIIVRTGLLLAALSLGSVVGCDALSDTHEIVGTWELTSAVVEIVDGEAITELVISSNDLIFAPLINFRKNNSMTITTCNATDGDYAVLSDTLLSITVEIGTLMLCGDDDGPDHLIERTLRDLQTGTTYVINGSELTLEYEGVTLKFVRQ